MKIKRITALMLIICILFTVPALAVSARAKKVVSIAVSQMGKPYKLASNPSHSFNCYTLVRYCYNKVKSGAIGNYKVKVPYTRISSIGKLQPGDIVCFKIGSGRIPKVLNYHFGIYSGNGYYIYASQSAGKVVSGKVSHYDGTFLCGIRVF